MTLDPDTASAVRRALEEDVGEGDWTTRWTVTAYSRATAELIAKATGVLYGLELFEAVFRELDAEIDVLVSARDGDAVVPGASVARLEGDARAILTGERTALNFLQRLSGIATLTRRYVESVAGTGAVILDTRKTTPGLRALEKAAVRAGGGQNHRAGLYDMVLIKENHIAVAGGIAAAIARVKAENTRGLAIEVEARSLDEVDAALAAGVDRILLDNMDVPALALAVRRVSSHAGARPRLEASGNMSLERVRAVAETGVDFISVGALTHSAPALDLSLLVRLP